jgi:hypothetical protein
MQAPWQTTMSGTPAAATYHCAARFAATPSRAVPSLEGCEGGQGQDRRQRVADRGGDRERRGHAG